MDPSTAPLLTAEAVRRSFGARPVLVDVDLEVHQGRSVALVGASGSGRSTLLRTLNRTEPVDGGTIRHRGVALPTGGSALATLRADVALVLPAFNLPANRPLRDTLVAAARRIRGWPAPRAEAAADAALARVGSEDEADRRPGDLTPAGALRAAIARALASDAEVLLLDGPTLGLAAAEAAALRDLLADLSTEVTLVVATDDEALVRVCTSWAVRLDAGRVLVEGDVETVLTEVSET